jgi:hypothetical protein
MPEAWDLMPKIERTADAITTFIVFCEDSVNEPAYFRSFQKPGKVKVNVVDGQLSSFKNIMNTLQYCEKEGLLEEVNNGHYQLKPGTTNHVWSVFDRDVETEDRQSTDPEKDMQFTLSIQAAVQAGLKVAWSNDVFELWILLHFEEVSPGVWRHRTYVYDRLTEIFRSMPDQSPEMMTITGRPNFNYKNDFKKRTNFILYVLPYLETRRELATQRAKALEAAFSAVHRYHQCNPCTKVYHLVDSIQSFVE